MDAAEDVGPASLRASRGGFVGSSGVLLASATRAVTRRDHVHPGALRGRRQPVRREGSHRLPPVQSVVRGGSPSHETLLARAAGVLEGLSATGKPEILVHKGHAEIPVPVQTSEVSFLISRRQREPFQPQPAQTLQL